MFGIFLKKRWKIVCVVYIIVSFLLLSFICVPSESPNSPRVVNERIEKAFESLEVTSRWLKTEKYHPRMRLIEYDGCEYLKSSGLVHKANCKNEIHKAVKNAR